MNETIKGPTVNQVSAEKQNTVDVVVDLPATKAIIKMMSDLMIQKEYINKMAEMAQGFNNRFPKEK